MAEIPNIPGAEKQIAFVHILRGLGSLLVVWSHLSGFWLWEHGKTWSVQTFYATWVVAPFHLFQNGGHLGVVLFFLVSGYIITHASLRETPREYVVKRLLRIFPALVGALVVTWLMLRLNASQGMALTGIREASWQMWVSAGLMLDGFVKDARILGPTWTLSVEITFYTLTLVLLNRSRLKPLQSTGLMLAGWMALTILLQRHPVGDNGIYLPMLAFLIVGRTIYFLQRGLIPPVDGGLLMGSALLSYVLFSEAAAPGELFKAGGTAPIVSDLLALLGFVALMRAPIASLWRPIQFLGDISYSLYLLHMPVGMTVLNFMVGWGFRYYVSFTLAVLVSIGLSYLSFKFIEQPFQRLARRSIAPKPVMAPAH